jgi:hypothetical protein
MVSVYTASLGLVLRGYTGYVQRCNGMELWSHSPDGGCYTRNSVTLCVFRGPIMHGRMAMVTPQITTRGAVLSRPFSDTYTLVAACMQSLNALPCVKVRR